MTRSTTITENANKRPYDGCLQMKLSELETEIADMSADRNRSIIELSREMNTLIRLLDGIQENGPIGKQLL